MEPHSTERNKLPPRDGDGFDSNKNPTSLREYVGEEHFRVSDGVFVDVFLGHFHDFGDEFLLLPGVGRIHFERASFPRGFPFLPAFAVARRRSTSTPLRRTGVRRSLAILRRGHDAWRRSRFRGTRPRDTGGSHATARTAEMRRRSATERRRKGSAGRKPVRRRRLSKTRRRTGESRRRLQVRMGSVGWEKRRIAGWGTAAAGTRRKREAGRGRREG